MATPVQPAQQQYSGTAGSPAVESEYETSEVKPLLHPEDTVQEYQDFTPLTTEETNTFYKLNQSAQNFLTENNIINITQDQFTTTTLNIPEAINQLNTLSESSFKLTQPTRLEIFNFLSQICIQQNPSTLLSIINLSNKINGQSSFLYDAWRVDSNPKTKDRTWSTLGQEEEEGIRDHVQMARANHVTQAFVKTAAAPWKYLKKNPTTLLYANLIPIAGPVAMLA